MMRRFPTTSDQFYDSYQIVGQLLLKSLDHTLYRCLCKLLGTFHFSYYKIHKNDKASLFRKAPIDRLVDDYHRKDFAIIYPRPSAQDMYISYGQYPPGTHFRSLTALTLLKLRVKRPFKSPISKKGFFYLLESLALICAKDKETLLQLFSEHPGGFILSVQSDSMESAARLIANVGGVTFASLELSSIIEFPSLSASIAAPLCVCIAEQMQVSELKSSELESNVDRLVSKMPRTDPFVNPGIGTLLLKMMANNAQNSRKWIERLKQEIEGLIRSKYQPVIQFQRMYGSEVPTQIERRQAELESLKKSALENWKILISFKDEMEKVANFRMSHLNVSPEEAQAFASLLNDEDISSFQRLLSIQ